MKAKGAFSLEAMIAFIAFISFIGLFLNSLSEQQLLAFNARDLMEAKSECIKCSQIIDSIYSNNAAKISEIKVNCFVEENQLKSNKNESKASSKTTASSCC